MITSTSSSVLSNDWISQSTATYISATDTPCSTVSLRQLTYLLLLVVGQTRKEKIWEGGFQLSVSSPTGFKAGFRPQANFASGNHLYHFALNLSGKQCTKLYWNHPSLVEDITRKRFGLFLTHCKGKCEDRGTQVWVICQRLLHSSVQPGVQPMTSRLQALCHHVCTCS